jgi:hypothetical protein
MGRELADEEDRAAAAVRSTQDYRGPGAAEKVVVPARVSSSGRSKAQRDDVETTAHAACGAPGRDDERALGARRVGFVPLPEPLSSVPFASQRTASKHRLDGMGWKLLGGAVIRTGLISRRFGSLLHSGPHQLPHSGPDMTSWRLRGGGLLLGYITVNTPRKHDGLVYVVSHASRNRSTRPAWAEESSQPRSNLPGQDLVDIRLF